MLKWFLVTVRRVWGVIEQHAFKCVDKGRAGLLAASVLAGAVILQVEEIINGVVPPAAVIHTPDTPVTTALEHGDQIIGQALNTASSGTADNPVPFSRAANDVAIRQWWDLPRS